MSWKGHLSVAAIVAILLTLILVMSSVAYARSIPVQWWEILFGIPIALYCGLLPDIDIKTSKVFGFTLTIAVILLVIFALLEMILPILVIAIFLAFTLTLTHRGVMHRWYIAIPIGIIFGFIFMSFVVGLYAGVGYFSHAGIEKSH